MALLFDGLRDQDMLAAHPANTNHCYVAILDGQQAVWFGD